MSHIVSITTEVRDATAVQAACHRLGLSEPTQGRCQLFSGEASGLLVNLPGWQYPVVCDLSSGQVRFDNYQGNWGDRKELDRFLQAYAVEKTRLEARKKGLTVMEQALTDGSIKLSVQLNGGAA